jgi:hypothetical protein
LAILGISCNGLGDHWHIAAGIEKKIRQILLAVTYRAKLLGILRCDACDMPTVGTIIVRSATVSKLDAK